MAKKYPGRRVADKSLDKIQLAKANDRYRNSKRVDDALHWMMSMFVRSLPVLAAGGIGYIVWYHLWGPHSNTEMLLGIATNVVIYFAGLVSPTITQRLKNNDSGTDSL